MKSTFPLWAALAALVLAGCATPHGYVDPASIHFDRPDNATLYDMKTAVADLVDKMKSDEGFQEHYELLASKKHDLPVLQIGNIDNISTNRVQQKLESARHRLETAQGSGARRRHAPREDGPWRGLGRPLFARPVNWYNARTKESHDNTKDIR